ncbi:MAG: helix-turn-helix domain-containing protein [Ruminococcaceae bacterium]|nr:helix-turn-helix domain-containing protein [Oscillospiraceae bacterium]
MTYTSTVDQVKSFSNENSRYIIQTIKNRLLFSKNHTHTFYEIVFVLTGKCVHSVCGKPLEMQSGDFIVIRPFDNHAILSADVGSDILCISLLKEEYQKYEILYGRIPMPKKSAQPHIAHLSTRINQTVKTLLKEEENYTDHNIRAICSVLFSEYYDIFDNKEEKIDAPRSLTMMMQKMRLDISLQKEGVNAMIRIAGFSISQLTRLMKKYYDTTPHKYLKELRLEMSLRLVTETNIPLESISYECGYRCYGYFTDIFKQRYGITPAAMRKSKVQN